MQFKVQVNTDNIHLVAMCQGRGHLNNFISSKNQIAEEIGRGNSKYILLF